MPKEDSTKDSDSRPLKHINPLRLEVPPDFEQVNYSMIRTILKNSKQSADSYDNGVGIAIKANKDLGEVVLYFKIYHSRAIDRFVIHPAECRLEQDELSTAELIHGNAQLLVFARSFAKEAGITYQPVIPCIFITAVAQSTKIRYLH